MQYIQKVKRQRLSQCCVVATFVFKQVRV